MQTITNEITSAYNSFRNWIWFRLDKEYHNNEFNEKRYLIEKLGVDKEPHSWLEKDILAHLESYKDRDRKVGGFYQIAFKDYLEFIKDRTDFRTKIFWVILIPFLLFSFLSVFSLLIILQLQHIHMYQVETVTHLTIFIKYLFAVAFLTLLHSVYLSLVDIKNKYINNPKTYA